MGIEPLKKELESIDQELESAMLRLAETTQRVDDFLADYQAGDGGERRAPAFARLRPTAEQEAAEESDDDSSDTETTEDSSEEDVERTIEDNDAADSSIDAEDETQD